MPSSRQKGPVILPLLLSVAFLVAFLGLVRVQRANMPADAILEGPLRGGADYIVPLLLCFFYLLIACAVLQKRSNSIRSAAFVSMLVRGRLGVANSVILVLCAIVCTIGTHGYWAARSDGVSVQTPLAARLQHYDWSDLSSRTLYCYRVRHATQAAFVLIFHDGRRLDFGADGPNTRLVENLPRLLSLTAVAEHTHIGQIDICPGRVAALYAGQKS